MTDAMCLTGRDFSLSIDTIAVSKQLLPCVVGPTALLPNMTGIKMSDHMPVVTVLVRLAAPRPHLQPFYKVSLMMHFTPMQFHASGWGSCNGSSAALCTFVLYPAALVAAFAAR